jgi:hypothetical protein
MLRVPNAVLFYFLFPFLVFPVEDNLVSLMEMGGGTPFFFKKKKNRPRQLGMPSGKGGDRRGRGRRALGRVQRAKRSFFPTQA